SLIVTKIGNRRSSFAADAAFALPAVYEVLEQRSVAYAIRLPANDVLERAIEDLLTRPRGRPSSAPLVRYRSFHYQAASWDRPRRVIAKIEHHLGELFPGVGFIVTTLTGTNRAVVRFYNGSSPTTSAICCAGSFCPFPSRTGPSPVSSPGSSRRADASSGMLGTSTCTLPKAT